MNFSKYAATFCISALPGTICENYLSNKIFMVFYARLGFHTTLRDAVEEAYLCFSSQLQALSEREYQNEDYE